MACSRCNYQNLVSSFERRCIERQRRSMEAILDIVIITLLFVGRRGRDRMVVRFTTIYAISAYHHLIELLVQIQLMERCIRYII